MSPSILIKLCSLKRVPNSVLETVKNQWCLFCLWIISYTVSVHPRVVRRRTAPHGCACALPMPQAMMTLKRPLHVQCTSIFIFSINTHPGGGLKWARPGGGVRTTPPPKVSAPIRVTYTKFSGHITLMRNSLNPGQQFPRSRQSRSSEVKLSNSAKNWHFVSLIVSSASCITVIDL